MMMLQRAKEGDHESDNYAYASARVKARKSTLIPRAQYEKFLVMDLPSIIRYIGETKYSNEINELSARYSDTDLVEMATNENLARNFHEVLNFCKGHLHTLVEKYLSTWDTWNIKTILRGKSYGATQQEILDDLIPAGTFSREDLRQMVALESIDALVEHLKGTKFHKHILAARAPSGTIDLMMLENALDREYYIDLLTLGEGRGWLSKVLERFFRKKIDLVNLKTLFKLKLTDEAPEYIASLMIPGGFELSEATLKRIAATDDYEKFLNELKPFKFWPAIKDQAESATESGTLNPVMSALDSYHFREASKFGKLYPLSVLPFLGYFIWKRIEVDNIRIICRGKQAGLSEELIRSMLIT